MRAIEAGYRARLADEPEWRPIPELPQTSLARPAGLVVLLALFGITALIALHIA